MLRGSREGLLRKIQPISIHGQLSFDVHYNHADDPDGAVDAARAAMLTDYGIEIGTSFGPLHGKVWRIGVMGYNARRDTVLTTLAALEQLLRRGGVTVPGGGGVDAALEAYGSAA